MTKSVTNNIIFLCHVDICLDTMLGSDGTCQRLGTFCLDASKLGHGGQSATVSSTTSLLLLHTFWPIHIVQGLTYGRATQCRIVFVLFGFARHSSFWVFGIYITSRWSSGNAIKDHTTKLDISIGTHVRSRYHN